MLYGFCWVTKNETVLELTTMALTHHGIYDAAMKKYIIPRSLKCRKNRRVLKEIINISFSEYECKETFNSQEVLCIQEG